MRIDETSILCRIAKRNTPTAPRAANSAVNKTPGYSAPSMVETVPAEEPGNLQPSGVLNQEAMRGKFSLRRILSTADSDAMEPPEASPPGRPEDPIEMGILSLSIAKSLFEKFVNH